MARKRRANGQPFGQSHSKRPKGDSESKLVINTWEDVADSEDEFHIGRDKVLLEETPAHKRFRKAQEEGQFLLGILLRPFTDTGNRSSP